MTTPLANFGAQLISGIAGKGAGAILERPLQGGTNVAWMAAAERLGFKRYFAEGYDAGHDAIPDGNTGVTTAGIVDFVWDLLYSVAKLSFAMDAEVLEDLVLEMASDGLSGAVQTSIGGAMQSIYNVWRGSVPPSADDISALFQDEGLLDKSLLTLLSAEAGGNIVWSAFLASQGSLRQAEAETLHPASEVANTLGRYSEASLTLHRVAQSLTEQAITNQLEKKREITARGEELKARSARRLLARLNELEDELESMKGWFDLGFISDSDAEIVATQIQVEADAVAGVYGSFATQVAGRVTTQVSAQAVQVGDYNQLVSAWQTVADNASQTLWAQETSILADKRTRIREMLSDLRAYRFRVSPGQTPPTNPVVISNVVAVGSPFDPIPPGTTPELITGDNETTISVSYVIS